MINSPNSWLVPTQQISLAKDDVHVWRATLDPPEADVAHFWTFLSADEQTRANRFRFDVHRRRFIVARGVLRKLLGRYLNLKPEAIQFHTTDHGKPYIRHMLHGSELCFNVSHSHEMALYAFTRDRRLGIDIEYRRNIVDLVTIAQHFFAPSEAELLLSLSPQIQPIAFLNCWTRKEAYIKGLGEGLSHPLNTFTVSLVPGEPARLLTDDGDATAPIRWQMSSFDAHPEYE
ncbi:MAG: 4'-phosphopantetheinyl transferase family protein, partial [Candidatus Promineifilaceae bacterium]